MSLVTVRRPKASRSTGHSTYWSRDRFRRGAGRQVVLRRDRFHITRAHERRDRFHIPRDHERRDRFHINTTCPDEVEIEVALADFRSSVC